MKDIKKEFEAAVVNLLYVIVGIICLIVSGHSLYMDNFSGVWMWISCILSAFLILRGMFTVEITKNNV